MNAEVPKVLECLRDDHYKLSPIARLAKTEMGFSSAFQTLTSGIASVKPLLSVICRNCGVLGSEFVCLTLIRMPMKYLKAIMGVNSFFAQLKRLSAHKSFLLLYTCESRETAHGPRCP